MHVVVTYEVVRFWSQVIPSFNTAYVWMPDDTKFDEAKCDTSFD